MRLVATSGSGGGELLEHLTVVHGRNKEVRIAGTRVSVCRCRYTLESPLAEVNVQYNYHVIVRHAR